MIKAKRLFLVGAAAALFVAVAIWFFGYYGHIGPEGPDTVGWIGLVIFFPAIWLSEGITSRVTETHVAVFENTLFVVLAFLQYFLVFRFFLWLASKLCRHNQPMQPTPR